MSFFYHDDYPNTTLGRLQATIDTINKRAKDLERHIDKRCDRLYKDHQDEFKLIAGHLAAITERLDKLDAYLETDAETLDTMRDNLDHMERDLGVIYADMAVWRSKLHTPPTLDPELETTDKQHLTVPVMLDPYGYFPTYATEGSAGADLRARLTNKGLTIKPGETFNIPTGVHLAIPDGYYGDLRLRSSLGQQGLTIPNGCGVIDSDYRGEIRLILHNLTNDPIRINGMDRIAQLVIVPYVKADFQRVDHLDNTQRGDGGFGSTGK